MKHKCQEIFVVARSWEGAVAFRPLYRGPATNRGFSPGPPSLQEGSALKGTNESLQIRGAEAPRSLRAAQRCTKCFRHSSTPHAPSALCAISLPVFHASRILRTCCTCRFLRIRGNPQLQTGLRYAEAHISTQPPPPLEGSWLSRSHGLQGRPGRAEPPPRQGPSQDCRFRRLPRLARGIAAISLANKALIVDARVWTFLHAHLCVESVLPPCHADDQVQR